MYCSSIYKHRSFLGEYDSLPSNQKKIGDFFITYSKENKEHIPTQKELLDLLDLGNVEDKNTSQKAKDSIEKMMKNGATITCEVKDYEYYFYVVGGKEKLTLIFDIYGCLGKKVNLDDYRRNFISVSAEDKTKFTVNFDYTLHKELIHSHEKKSIEDSHNKSRKLFEAPQRLYSKYQDGVLKRIIYDTFEEIYKYYKNTPTDITLFVKKNKEKINTDLINAMQFFFKLCYTGNDKGEFGNEYFERLLKLEEFNQVMSKLLQNENLDSKKEGESVEEYFSRSIEQPLQAYHLLMRILTIIVCLDFRILSPNKNTDVYDIRVMIINLTNSMKKIEEQIKKQYGENNLEKNVVEIMNECYKMKEEKKQSGTRGDIDEKEVIAHLISGLKITEDKTQVNETMNKTKANETNTLKEIKNTSYIPNNTNHENVNETMNKTNPQDDQVVKENKISTLEEIKNTSYISNDTNHENVNETNEPSDNTRFNERLASAFPLPVIIFTFASSVYV